ncbi:MAG: hypothetical protein P8X46_06260 [Nitrospirales bacterium]
MMNPVRITMTLALVVLGLGGYILLIDIPPFDDRAVTHITWASPTETIHLERDDQWRWEITEPMRSPADAR